MWSAAPPKECAHKRCRSYTFNEQMENKIRALDKGETKLVETYTDIASFGEHAIRLRKLCKTHGVYWSSRVDHRYECGCFRVAFTISKTQL